MKLLTLVLVLGACSSPELVDPSGSWSMTASPTSGNCGIAAHRVVIEVTPRAGGDYAVSDPGANSVTGQISCTPDHCEMLFTETASGVAGDGTPFTSEGDGVWTLDAAGSIMGTLEAGVFFQTGTSCSQSFVMTGVLL